MKKLLRILAQPEVSRAESGYLSCGNDGPPGAEITWDGQAALSFTAWILGHSVDAGGDDSAVRKHIS